MLTFQNNCNAMNLLKMPIAAMLLAGALFPNWCQAQESINYLLFDASKMQCYEYVAAENFPNVAYWDYHLKMKDDKKLIFRVLKMNIYQDTVSAVDKEPLAAEALDQTFVDAVNSAAKYVYVLEQKSEGVVVKRQVERIIQTTELPNFVSYRDQKHDFEYAYDKIYKDSEKNISLLKDKGAKVLYQSQTKKECLKVRSFRTFTGHVEDPFEDVKFAEGIGLYSVTVSGAELKLKSINDIPIDNFIKSHCLSLDAAEKIKLQNAEKVTTTTTTTTNTNPYAGTTTTTTKTDTTQKPKTSPYGGTSTDPYGGTMGTGGTTPDTKILNQEFVVDKNPCDGVSPLDVNNPCNQMVVINKPQTPRDSLPPDGIYIAKQGDNLYKIANKFGTTTKILMCLNNKKDQSVGIMEKILVVDKDGTCTQSKNPFTRINNETRTVTKVHVVEQGENLGKIAAKYNTTIDKLCKLNGFTDETKDKIQIDQEIVVSVENF